MSENKNRKNKKKKQNVVNTGSIFWKQNFYNVLKGVRKLNFWGDSKKKFLLHIPEEVDIKIDQQLKVIRRSFKNINPKGRELTKRKYILLHAMNSMGILMEETEREGKVGLHSINEREMMGAFINEYWKQLEEELGYVIDKSRHKKEEKEKEEEE